MSIIGLKCPPLLLGCLLRGDNSEIENCIQWADKMYNEICKSKEPAVAYIRLEGVSMIRELVVPSDTNGKELHYKAIIENIHSLHSILPSEQFNELLF